jgi:hypothetical protein
MNTNFQYHAKQRVSIIWQAKAACTIVNKMYYEEEGLLDTALDYSSWIHNYRKKHNKETAKIRHNSILSPKTKYVQFVVNPYRRAVSSYIHSCKKNYAGLANPHISFDEFCDKILNDEIVNEIHHNRQIFHLHAQKPIHYVKMENIEEELPKLNAKYGLHYSLKSSKHHATTHDISETFLGKTSWRDISQIPKDYTNFYNDEIKKKVGIIYGSDIKHFKYTWDEFVQYSKK